MGISASVAWRGFFLSSGQYLIEVVPSKLGMPEDNWNAYNISMQERVVAETMRSSPAGTDVQGDDLTERREERREVGLK